MWPWLIALLLGAPLGAAVGFFGPPFLFGMLSIGTGSYEDVMFIWLVTVPGGLVVGGWAGYQIGRWIEERRASSDRAASD